MNVALYSISLAFTEFILPPVLHCFDYCKSLNQIKFPNFAFQFLWVFCVISIFMWILESAYQVLQKWATGILICKHLNKPFPGFPGSPVVTNSPTNEEDTGSIPDQEDPTCFLVTQPAPQLLRLHSRACALQLKKPLQWEAHTLQRRVAPTLLN